MNMNWINGNKTIIGQAAIIVLMIFQPKLDPAIFTGLISLVTVLTGASMIHHVKKQVK